MSTASSIFDYRYFKKDLSSAPYSLYCNSVTGSDYNDGLDPSRAFGANLDVMFDALVKDVNNLPTIYIAAGSYTMSKQKNYFYHASIPNFRGTMSYLTWPGGGSQAATTIGAVLTNTRDLGISFTISGGYNPDGTAFTTIANHDTRYINQRIRYQTGACAGNFATIYDTVAPNVIFITQIGNDFSLLPVGGNTFKYLFHDATVNILNDITFFDYNCQFLQLKIAGDYNIQMNQATVYFNDISLNVRSVNPGGGQSSAYFMNNTYFKPTATGGATLMMPNGTIFTQNGCVFDGLNNTQYIQPASWRFKGETILKNIKYISMRGSSVDKNDVDSTLRFFSCESGFTEAIAYPFTYSRANLPYIAGNITTGWLVNMNSVRGTQYALSGGTVSTPYGTNAITVNGSAESYDDYSIGCHAYQQGVDGGNDRYLRTTSDTPAIIDSVPVAEGKTLRYRGKVIGKTADSATVNIYTIDAVFKRQTAGNVTLVHGGVTADHEDDATCDVQAVANIGTQTADIVVTGLVAPTAMEWCSMSDTMLSKK